MATPKSRAVPDTAAHQHTLREQNLALVASAVLTAPEPVSRAEVATATQLARATVSTLVDRLVLGGVLQELPPVSGGGAGRPKVPLVAAPRTYVGLGLEVAGSYLGGSVIDLTGTTVDQEVEHGDFRDQDPAVLLGRLGALARRLIKKAHSEGMRVAGATLAVPGLVATDQGFVQVAPNLGWSNLEPAPYLGLADFPVRVDNEAVLAALAELQLCEEDSFLFVTADIAVGCAVVLNGQVFRGQRGWAGEIGHMVVDPAGPKCRCGSHGCMESYAGKAAIMEGCGLDANDPVEDVVAKLEAGDQAALAAINLGAWAVGAAVADAINLLDLTTVVVGGELAALVPWVHQEVQQQIQERVLSGPYGPVTLRAAATGPFAAMTGGGQRVLAELLADPAKWV